MSTMTTDTTKTRPQARRIQGPDDWELHVDEDYREQMMESIFRGDVIESHASPSRTMELRATRFTDPRTGDVRFAVEEWIGWQKYTVDYPDEERAQRHLARAKGRLTL